jgi:hypothetical protein
MDSKRLVTRVVVGGIVMYLLGILFWQMLFASYFESHAGPGSPSMSQAPILWASILGTLCYATLIALALNWTGAADMGSAFKTGALVAVLMWGAVDLTFYAFFGLSDIVGTFSDIVLEFVRGGVTGIAMVAVGTKSGEAA